MPSPIHSVPVPRQQVAGHVRRGFALAALADAHREAPQRLFTVGGLLPDRPSRVRDPFGSGGWVVTAFTLGAVVGAPILAATTGRLPRKSLLLGLLAVFVASSVLVAILPSFALVVAARVVNGIPVGVYMSTAILVAAGIMAPGRRGRGVAIVSAGPTVAVLTGAPLGTSIGQLLGWRVVFFLVAAIFALALVAIALALPSAPGDPAASIRKELVALWLPQVWLRFCSALSGSARCSP